MRNFDCIIRSIETLKPVSHLGDKIAEIISNPGYSLNELVDVVKYDQGITANLLRICNSSFLGLRKKIVTVKQAVAYLGADKVSNLIMIAGSDAYFKGVQTGYDLGDGELWLHSVASALLAQDLAEQRGVRPASAIFTSALLKDIGKVILHPYVGEDSDKILKLVNENHFSFVEAERDILGIDHAELGARIAERWHFSPKMVDIIRHHHTPDGKGDFDPELAIVYLSDAICMMLGIGVGMDGLAYRHFQEVVARLGFTDMDLQNAIAGFWEKFDGILDLLNMAKGDS